MAVEKRGPGCYYKSVIERREIEKLAMLAKIALSESELAGLQGEVDAILEHISEIQGAGEGNGAPETALICNVFRDDGEPHASGIFTEALLNAAAKREGKYIKVKKIL